MTATSTLLAPPDQRYELKWAKSKKLLEAFIDHYNNGRPLREQLRQAHRDLAEALLFFYSVALKSQQAYVAPLRPGDTLPVLRANNVQLATKLNCSERTIINLRRRLAAAGLTIWHDWHGTNSQFELMLNPDILQLEIYGDPANQVEAFQTIRFQCMTQSLRHTVTSTIQVTSKLNKLEGEENQQPALPLGLSCELPVDFQDQDVEKAENVVGLPQSKSEPGTTPGTTGTGYTTSSDAAGYTPPVAGTPPARRGGGLGSRMREKLGGSSPTPPSCAPQPDPVPETPHSSSDIAPPAMPTPPAAPPGHFAQVIYGLPVHLAQKLEGHVNVMYTAAIVNLYGDKFIHDEEETRTRALLAEYLRYGKPENWSTGVNEMLERIILVRKWIKRGEIQNQTRWVPLPSIYFDIRNPNGFLRTKAWFKQHRIRKLEIANSVLLTKAYNEYVASLQPGAAISPQETYRRISLRLNKRDRALLDQFNQRILQYRHAS